MPPESSPAPPSAYAAAGVDIAAGERAVQLLKRHTERTRRPEVRTDASGFAGLFKLDIAGYRAPLLTSSTDGVGTKVMIAQALDRHDTIGIDLVGMVIDDLVVVGAEPLFMTDYIACGRVVPERIAAIVGGIAEGCVQAGCTLIAGETAEHPGVLAEQEYDLAGSGTGIVEADAVLGPHRVRPGDSLIALGSSGPHANGYSLIRRILDTSALTLDTRLPELGEPLGEALLRPTRIYAAACRALVQSVTVRAYAHITGGGLAANLARSLPEGLGAVVDRAAWTPPPVFTVLSEHGNVSRADMEATFNMGVGMVAIVAAEHCDAAVALLNSRGTTAWPLGHVAGEHAVEKRIVAGRRVRQQSTGKQEADAREADELNTSGLGAVRLTGDYAR